MSHSGESAWPDPEERRRAVSRLAELPVAQRIAPLLTAMGDADWRVRKEAVGFCAEQGAEPALVAALVDVFAPGENVGLRNAAVEALGAFGLSAVGVLSLRMPGLDADGKKLAIEALGRSGEPTALDALATVIADGDANVRLAAIDAIGAVGATRVDEARTLLLARLDGAHPLEVLAALESLSSIGAGLPFVQLEPWFDDPLLGRPALRLAAQSGEPLAAPRLVRALLAPRELSSLVALAEFVACSERARAAASAELAQLGEPAEAALLSWLQGDSADVCGVQAALAIVGGLERSAGADLAVAWLSDARCGVAAEQALFLLGTAAAPALVAGASAPDTDTAAACLELMGRLPVAGIDREARRVLRAALASPAPAVVRSALSALTRVGDADCLTELVGLLSDTALVGSAESALGVIALRYPERALALLATTTAQGGAAHAAAVVIAALAGGSSRNRLDASELAAFLCRLLTSASHDERRAALAALAALHAGEALDAVKFALADEEESVRVEAVRALGSLRGADGSLVGVPALLEVVAERRELSLILAALRSLGGSSDPRALAVLGPMVSAPDARIAVTVVEALAKHADPRRVSALLDALHHTDSEVVKAGILAIAAEPDVRVLVHLGACLDQPAWDVRRLAADLLGRSPSEPSVAMLLARLAVEDDPMVKEALLRALDNSGQRRSRPPRRPQGEP